MGIQVVVVVYSMIYGEFFLDPRLVVLDFFHQEYYISRWWFHIVQISDHTDK